MLQERGSCHGGYSARKHGDSYKSGGAGPARNA